ncbi:sulfite exporter TauE/SafE family protein [Nonomuraea sp. NPDC003214]
MAFGAFAVALMIGLTGMGGGALMTPMLVTFFGVSPMAAVSSDLVAAAVMKPVGSAVHYRRGTIDLRLVAWLCAGSVPAAFGGVLVARALGDGERVHDVIEIAMAAALLIAAATLAHRSYRAALDRVGRSGGGAPAGRRARSTAPLRVRPVPTAAVGALGGLVVGITSVGSGSLIIVALVALYPMLKANQLVGTDLLQAVPLVISAAIGHLLFGDFRLEITTALLAGSLPGIYLGARISSRAPAGPLRLLLTFLLLASAAKMAGLGPAAMTAVVLAAVAATLTVWLVIHRRYGVPLRRRAAEERDAVESSSA